MVRIQLESGYLDVAEDTAFPLNFGVADVRDVSARSGAFSKTITLSGTKNNHDLLNHYYDVNIVAGTFNINTLTKCIVIQNGLPVMENATLQLISVNKSQKTDAYEHEVSYSVLVKDSQADFFTKLDNKELTDIDFSDLNHVLNTTNVVASWANDETDGYKYPVTWSGDTYYYLKEMRPAIYAKTYFDRIFQNSGFNYVWSSLTDAHFDKLLIPYNGEAIQNDYTSYIVNATDSVTINGYQTTGTNVSFSEQLQSWTENIDASNLFTPLTGSYSPPFYIDAGDSVNFECTLDFDVNLVNSSGGTAYLTSALSNLYLYQPKIYVKKNGVLLTNSGSQLQSHIISTVTGNSIANGSTTIITQTVTINIPIGGLLPTDVITLEGGVTITDGVGSPFWRSANNTIAPLVDVDVELDIQRIDINATISTATVPSGATMFVNKVVPQKIKQKDFIKSIFQMYNLYVEVDPSTPNTLNLLHRDDYYDNGAERDWTLKLAKDKEQTLQFLPELSAKKIVLTYKQDGDEPNKTYFDGVREIYGQVEFTYSNEYVRGVDTKELVFSPTPIGKTPFNAYVPMISGMFPRTNIRILYDGGMFTCDEFDIYDYSTTGQIGLTSYPLVHHWNDPLNPSFDINFAACDYYYYDSYNLTNNNLYNLYWRRTINQINTGKMLIAYFDLNESDIQSLKLNDKIRIDNSWWNINKVIDYDCNTSNLTKVELMSVDTEIDFAPFKTKIPTKPNVTEYIGITRDIIQRKIDGANTVAKGADVVIKGYGNVVNPDVKAVIIGDNMYITEDGVYTDKINAVAPGGDNFANADLVFDAVHTHDMNGFGVILNNGNFVFNNGGFVVDGVSSLSNSGFAGYPTVTIDGTLSGETALKLTSSGGGLALDIDGGIKRKTSSSSSNSNLGLDQEVFFANCPIGGMTVTLPTTTLSGLTYTIKHNSLVGTVTVDTAGAETIDGSASIALASYDSFTVIWNGTEWSIV
jgi:hypothetical protein